MASDFQLDYISRQNVPFRLLGSDLCGALYNLDLTGCYDYPVLLFSQVSWVKAKRGKSWARLIGWKACCTGKSKLPTLLASSCWKTLTLNWVQNSSRRETGTPIPWTCQERLAPFSIWPSVNNKTAFIRNPVPAAKVTDTCHILEQLITSASEVTEYL